MRKGFFLEPGCRCSTSGWASILAFPFHQFWLLLFTPLKNPCEAEAHPGANLQKTLKNPRFLVGGVAGTVIAFPSWLTVSPWRLISCAPTEPTQKRNARTNSSMMPMNRRTSVLLAAGVISLARMVRAEEHVSVSTALTGTTISGFVDTSAQWNFGTGNRNNPAYSFGGDTKADGFNLNVVQVSLAKPQDDSPWAAGYNVDLWFGPDANTLASQASGMPGSDFGVRQAYVALRTPVGNGIDWKAGVFDTIIGYEVLASGNNPNFTRSWGFTVEPTTHTGIQGNYKLNDCVSFCACVANTFGPTINGRAFPTGNGAPASGTLSEAFKTYMGSLALTAPTNWGWAAGSTLSAGVINGYNSSPGDSQTSWYLGGTLATPVAGLKLGAAVDYVDLHHPPAGAGDNLWVIGGYASYQATEKLSFNGRGEYFVTDGGAGLDTKLCEFTLTAQYDLWKNVLSRLEFRWDHSDSGPAFGEDSSGSPNRKNAFMLVANVIYKF